MKKEQAKELRLQIAQLEKEKQKLQDKLHKPIKDSSDDLKKELTKLAVDMVDDWELHGHIYGFEFETKPYDRTIKLAININYEQAKGILNKVDIFRERLECYG